MSSPPTNIGQGTLIAGKYRVERVLGEGAMGVVLAARHIVLDELRAIKLMLPSALGDASNVERFLREARAAVRLRSNHVCKVLDVGRLDDGAPYIVMEYLEGADLKSILEERGKLPIIEAVRHVIQACEAVAEAHALGIVHRDIKPANLFLTAGVDGVSCVKVLDFGIAKMAAPSGALEMTQPQEVIGTPVFMAPEQMRGMHDVDARADVWGLGVVLYRALTGQLPFTGSTITQVCAAVIADPPLPVAAMGAVLPAALEAIVLRCLEKDPSRRLQSATELAAALAPFAGVPVTATGSFAIPSTASAGGTTSAHAAFATKPVAVLPATARGVILAGVGAGVLTAVLGFLVALLALPLQPGAANNVAPASAGATAAPAASVQPPSPSIAVPAPTVSAAVVPSAAASARKPETKAKSTTPARAPDAYGNQRK